jgi:hypothetical protein
MTPIQLGWLAGIIDGEGCITVTKQKPGSGGRRNTSHRLYLKVTMCDEATIDHIKAITGTGAKTSSKIGAWSRSWTWWAANVQATAIIKRVRRHLITKAYEADLALEWRALGLSPAGGHRGSQPIPPDLLRERERLFVALRDAKPSARFRRSRLA